MSSDTKKSVLGGHIYLVEHVDDGRLVHKVVAGGEEKEVYFVDRDEVCECPAGQHGRECKHIHMAADALEGPRLSKAKARRMLESYLDKAREELPNAKFSNLLRFKKDEYVTVATALATRFDVGCTAERFTLWTEVEGMLIRVHVFKDPSRYRAALHSARTHG